MVDHDSTRPSLQLVKAPFSNFLLRKLSQSSNFVDYRYYTNFKLSYFHTTGGYHHMVGHAGSPICIAHTDVTLT